MLFLLSLSLCPPILLTHAQTYFSQFNTTLGGCQFKNEHTEHEKGGKKKKHKLTAGLDMKYFESP